MKLDVVPNAPEWLRRCPKTGRFYVSKFRADLPVQRLERKIRNPTGDDEKLTISAAKRLGEKMIADWMSGHLEKKRKRVTVKFAIAQLLEYRKGRFEAGKIRKRTWNHDRAWLPVLERWFGAMDPKEIDEQFWETWHEETGQLMNRTHADTAKYLSMLLTFCHKQKWITRKPVIRNLDGHSYKGRIYTNDEVQALHATADRKMQGQIILGYECGMRTHEVRELQWSMVMFGPEGAVISIPEWFAKTGEAREFLASPRASGVLRELHEGQPTGPFVYPSPDNPEAPESDSSFYARFRKAVVSAKVQGRARFYDLRHTFFNRLVYEEGLDRNLVAEYGGNSASVLKRDYLRKTSANTKTIAGKVGLEDCGKSAEETGERRVEPQSHKSN